MSAHEWAAVDDWRIGQEGLRRNARRQLSQCTDSVWHARMTSKAWRYRTKAGEEREWLQHQLAHARNWERVSVWGLCSEGRGAIPAIEGKVAHRLTRNLKTVTCRLCCALLDREMEAGRLRVDEKTLNFEPEGAR